MEVYAPNPAQVGGKEKQMPDWGPINDSKSATYLLAYVALHTYSMDFQFSRNQIEIEKRSNWVLVKRKYHAGAILK